MAKKLLTISLLVSGREDTTKKCLDSLHRLLEELDSELILVDTGCKEPLKALLRGYTDQIVPFTWCNDFAKARNEGLRRANGEWFLFFDDDEWFEDVSPIIDFFKSGEYREYHQAVYKARNYSNPEGTAYNDEWVSRMIRVEEDTRFEGKVHEALVPARGKCKRLDAFVHHFGYAFTNDEAKKKHFDRNVTLLNSLIEEEPDNLRWRLEILLEYSNMGEYEKLEQVAENAMTKISKVDQPFVNQCRGAFATALLLSKIMQKEYAQVQKCGTAELSDSRYTLAARCSLCIYLAKAARELYEASKDSADAETVSQLLLDVYEATKEYVRCYELWKLQELEEQEQIIAESILFVKDATSDTHVQAMKMWQMHAMVKLGRASEIPQEYVEEFSALLRDTMDGNGEFLLFLDNYWELGEAGVFPLEDILLSLPLSQWMVMALVMENKHSAMLWAEVQQHLMGIKTGDDIRYLYFDMHAINDVLVKYSLDLDYEEMCQQLQEFAECNLRYADYVYTEKAFEGDMEMVEDNCRAAIWIEKMLECDEADVSGKLECLKKAALAWPKMSEIAKRFAMQLGEEQKRQAEEAEAAGNELREIAEQVKGQIATLLNAGMNAEALGIVRQLRQMLPYDKEIAKLEKDLEKKFS